MPPGPPPAGPPTCAPRCLLRGGRSGSSCAGGGRASARPGAPRGGSPRRRGGPAPACVVPGAAGTCRVPPQGHGPAQSAATVRQRDRLGPGSGSELRPCNGSARAPAPGSPPRRPPARPRLCARIDIPLVSRSPSNLLGQLETGNGRLPCGGAAPGPSCGLSRFRSALRGPSLWAPGRRPGRWWRQQVARSAAWS